MSRLAAAGFALVLLTAACSDNGDDGAASGTTAPSSAGQTDSTGAAETTVTGGPETTRPAERLTLRLVSNAAQEPFAPIFAAQALGYFEDENLDVQLQFVGSSPLTQLLTDAADLAAFGGFSATMNAVNSDAPPLHTIYNLVSTGISLYAIGAPDITNIADCTRVTNPGVGSAGFTWAQTIKSLIGATYDIVPAQDVASMTALFTSGNADCMIFVYSGTAPLVDAGQANWLINPEDLDHYPYPEGLTQDQIDAIPGGTIYGKAEWLDGHHEEAVRFLRAIQRALPLLDGPPEDLVDLLMQNADYNQSVQGDPAVALDRLTHALPYISATDGEITEDSWEGIQDYVIAGGASFVDKSDSRWDYDNFVDMSFLDEANQG